MGMVPALDHDSFSIRSILFKRPPWGRQVPVEGHGAFGSDAWWSALKRAFLSPTKRFQVQLLLQRSDATMAANSAVWIVHASYPNLLGSLSRTGLDAAEGYLK